MPCNTIQTATIDIGKMNEILLRDVMIEMNISNYRIVNGELIIRGQRGGVALEAEIKRQYSRQVVLSQAKKFGWKMKEVSPNQWQVQR